MLRNKMLLWHLSNSIGNTPLEQLDLKIRHSREARKVFIGDNSDKRPHSLTLQAIGKIATIIQAQSLYDAVNWTNPVTVDIVSNNKSSTVVAADPIIEAISQNHVLRVKTNISKEGPTIVYKARDKDGNTPIHIAASTGNKLILDLLLQCIDNKSPTMVNDNDETPLMTAIQFNSRSCVDAFLARKDSLAELSHVSALGMTVVFFAAASGNIPMMQAAVDAGVDVLRCDNRGNSPLHAAASRGHCDVIQLLVDKCWGDVNAKNESKWTPLHWAACNGRTDACRLLVKLGAEVNALGSAEETPCFLSYIRRHRDTFQTMLELGGEAVSKDSPPNVRKFRPPIDLAAKNQIIKELQRLEMWPSKFGIRRSFLGKSQI